MNLQVVEGKYVMKGESIPYKILINEVEDSGYVYRWYILATGARAGNLIAIWDNSGLLWINALQFPRYSGLVEHVGKHIWEFVVKTWEKKK